MDWKLGKMKMEANHRQSIVMELRIQWEYSCLIGSGGIFSELQDVFFFFFFLLAALNFLDRGLWKMYVVTRNQDWDFDG